MIRFPLGLPFSYRQRTLAASRPPMSKDKFISSIVAEGGDGLAADKIWNALASARVIDEFTPYPGDSLGRVYGIAEEELDQDLIARVFMDLELASPDREVTNQFGVIDSPQGVALFVSRCQQRSVM